MGGGACGKCTGFYSTWVIDCGDYFLLAFGELGYLYDAGCFWALTASYEFTGFWYPFNFVWSVVDTSA